ncbi:RING-type domain-containing protein [Mycena venus]|uniref:RING-type domain-containing protein n=1 Tax=Mycena venus TaxID=2733690 RepID=A0A8H6Y752_9AGAR|nr:RING-type domain-containing protein [Mycena venus]
MSATTIPSSSAFDVKYCSLCDAYFYSAEMLKAHLQSSSRHPQCTTCNKRFLNNNSLRNVLPPSSLYYLPLNAHIDLQHYVLSTKHNFCRICEKHFKTSAGLRIHIDFSHLDSDTEDGPSTRPDGWEDQLGLEADAALNGGEIPIPPEDIAASNALSGLASRIAVLNLRRKTGANAVPTGVLRPTCPICLSTRKKKLCATRCGHVFCSACITHALNETKSCPSCRQPAVTSQLRTLDLHVFGGGQ